MDGLGLTYSVWGGLHPRFPNPIMGSSWAPDGCRYTGREGGTFFLKSLSSLPGFSCHRKKGQRACFWTGEKLSPLHPTTPQAQSLQ